MGIIQITLIDALQKPLQAAGTVSQTNFDWRNYKGVNYVTSVKYQQGCGSCWTFATAAFFESQLLRRNITKTPVDLSQQYFLQCDKASFGCQGGFMNTAVSLGLKTGVPLQRTYPYNYSKVYPPTICLKPSVSYKFSNSSLISYWSPTIRYSDDKIISYLLQRPIIIGVNANDWFFYKPSATKRTLSCTPANSQNGMLINHAVLLVGYNDKEWIIKNSWNNQWGVNGYVYVSRDLTRNCGIGFEIQTIDYKLPGI